MDESSLSGKVAGLACLRCGTVYPPDFAIDSKGCAKCYAIAPAALEVTYTAEALAARKKYLGSSSPSLSKYSSYLPVAADALVSLGEGGTPLLAAERLGAALGIDGLFIKDESRNPTWSHKDRFSALAVTRAVQLGQPIVATASSGNAGASLAAYAAKAGLACVVLTFAGAAGPMLDQIRSYGAMVLALKDKSRRWPLLAEGARRLGWFATSPFSAPAVGSHPFGIEGYKTIAYELFEQMHGDVPDWCIVPTAYGDVLRGIWRGFTDLQVAGLITRLPRMAAAEIYGSLARTLDSSTDAVIPVTPEFETRALSIGTLQGTYQALISLRQSDGLAVAVDDQALSSVQMQLARTEGLFGELSGIAAVAAAGKLRQAGAIAAGDRVVCLMTASGLKDLAQRAGASNFIMPFSGELNDALLALEREYGVDLSELSQEKPPR